MKLVPIRLIIFLLIFVEVSCGASYKDADSSLYSETMMLDEMSAPENTPDSYQKKQDIRKIIKTASVRMELKNYDESLKNIKADIKKFAAYVASENEINDLYNKTNTIIIRVPKQSFDTLINSLVQYAERLNQRSINLQDVTEEFVDVKARLTNKKQVEAHYLEILKQAKSVNEILNVEEHLRKIREEIEAKEARLKYLSNQVGFSTITLSIYQVYESEYALGFFDKIFAGFSSGWEGFLSFLIAIVSIWPFLLIITALFFALRPYWNKRRAKI